MENKNIPQYMGKFSIYWANIVTEALVGNFKQYVPQFPSFGYWFKKIIQKTKF